VIADVGSGTGISSELFLEHGNRVFGIEPNLAMRQAAEAKFQHRSDFVSVAAQAEATTLPSGSLDHVVCGQAFHWFDQREAALEFARILRPRGWIVLMWNSRRLHSTPFLRAYEALLLRYATDYQQVCHNNVDAESLRTFFADGSFSTHRLDNEQRFDFEGLKGRLLSSSYVPLDEHPNYRPMLVELANIFEQHQAEDQVCFEYDTEIYIGHVAEP
jgi:SAM-dependent methyltransferase